MKIEIASLPQREIMPGLHARIVQADQVMLMFWQIEEGALLPEHHHPHEQIMTIQKGSLEMTVAGETQVFGPGEMLIIPGDAVHSGRAITAVEIFDVCRFNPRDMARAS